MLIYIWSRSALEVWRYFKLQRSHCYALKCVSDIYDMVSNIVCEILCLCYVFHALCIYLHHTHVLTALVHLKIDTLWFFTLRSAILKTWKHTNTIHKSSPCVLFTQTTRAIHSQTFTQWNMEKSFRMLEFHPLKMIVFSSEKLVSYKSFIIVLHDCVMQYIIEL